MSNPKAVAVQKLHPRPGEGHIVDAVTLATNGAESTLSLDLSNMPVPDRRFTCDAVGLDASPDAVRLLFAQRQPVGKGILSMLVISMAPESVVQLLGTITPEFREPLDKWAPTHGTRPLSDFQETPAQSVILTSSIAMVGYAGLNGCMDFYYASPFSTQNVGIVKKMAIESVVRVNLPTTVMISLIDALRANVEQPAQP